MAATALRFKKMVSTMLQKIRCGVRPFDSGNFGHGIKPVIFIHPSTINNSINNFCSIRLEDIVHFLFL